MKYIRLLFLDSEIDFIKDDLEDVKSFEKWLNHLVSVDMDFEVEFFSVERASEVNKDEDS